MNKVLIFICSLFLLLACGKKTNPEPPEFRAPNAVQNLNASSSDSAIQLSWSLPSKNQKGKDLNNLNSITVKRKSYDSKRFKEIAILKPNSTSFTDRFVEIGQIYDYIVFVSNDQEGRVNSMLRVKFSARNSKINILEIN